MVAIVKVSRLDQLNVQPQTRKKNPRYCGCLAMA
jgi:hypothetical protein